MKKLLAGLVWFHTALVASAHISLPAVIGSNMVLQQRSSVKLWGWGNPTEMVRVTTSWNGRTDSVVVGGDAKWQLAIQTPPAGGPYTISIRGDNVIELTNVLIGEVWVCSGQSNMEMNYYWGLPQMRNDLPPSTNPSIRFFSVPRTTANAPQEDCRARWTLCDSNTVKSFSAVGYYFGRRLHTALNVPVGLVSASWSGTPAEAWTPAHLVTRDSVLHRAANKQTPSAGWPVAPGATYNGMIAPITNHTIAGVIWYQGESNTTSASSYDLLMRTMISAWREAWGRSFPFYFVQLAPFRYDNKNIGALLREQQAATTSLVRTGMIVTTDLVDDTLNIHPKNKRDVGLRLANLALQDTYGNRLLAAKSPEIETVSFKGAMARMTTRHAESGLVVKGRAITGILLSGSDRRFHPATATISGNVITARSAQVSQPVAVRYAFSNTAVGNIFGGNHLPLAPFRSDDWVPDTSSDR